MAEIRLSNSCIVHSLIDGCSYWEWLLLWGMICSVGYALNPKKLRKSGLEETTNTTQTNPSQSTQQQEIASIHPSLHPSLHSSPCSSGSVSNTAISTTSTSQLTSQANCHATPLTNTWRGGGLADIISGGLECEGVKFIPWNWEVPVAQQVRKNILRFSLLLG